MRRPLLAVDASVLLHRGGLTGSVNEIAQVIKSHAPRAVAVCMGLGAAKHRLAQFPGYHSNRLPRSPELKQDFKLAPNVYRAFGWMVYDSPTHEGDDLLFSLAKTEGKAGGRTIILTQDKDLFGAVDAKTRVAFLGIGSGRFTLYGPRDVQLRCGVPPVWLADYIALVGDRSDGIPGAKGIGHIKAVELLRNHISLECVLLAHPELDAQELRRYKRVAQLQMVKATPPPSSETKWDRGLKELKKIKEQTHAAIAR